MSILAESFRKEGAYELLPASPNTNANSNENIKTSEDSENFILFSVKLNTGGKSTDNDDPAENRI
jgi:hypothetical protein